MPRRLVNQSDAAPASGEALLRLADVQHLGFVVESIEDEARRWIKRFGVGPWLVSEFCLPGNEPRTELTTAFAQWGNLQVELLMQRNSVGSCFRDWLRDDQSSRLHHICTHTSRFEQDLNEITAAGGSVELLFGLERGTEAEPSRFAMVASPLADGIFHEFTQPGTFVAAQSEAVRNSARGWDGSNAIRPMPLIVPT